MTLVIARRQANEIFILADTMITDPRAIKPLREGVIKSCILSPNVCVSFANSPDLAARDIGRALTEFPSGPNYKQAVDFFKKSSRETGVDYIVAFADPAKVVAVKDGTSKQTELVLVVCTGWQRS